jgi:GAF domain-containing protein
VRATADRSRPSFTDDLLCFLLAASRFLAVAAILAWLLQGLRAEPSLAQRLLGAALVTLATGQKQSPMLADAPFRDAVRTLIYGQGAGGAF